MIPGIPPAAARPRFFKAGPFFKKELSFFWGVCYTKGREYGLALCGQERSVEKWQT